MKTLVKAAGAIIATIGLWLGSAHAHTQLSSSIPANDAVMDAAPQEVSLSFSENVRLTAVSLASGAESHTLDIASSDPAKQFTVALPALAAGMHVVQWRALSADTHVITGEIRFTVSH